MKYNTIIFDLDGTLLNTLQDLTASVNHTLTHYGYPERTLEEIRSFIGNGVRILLTRAFPKDFPEDSRAEALEIFRKHYAVHMYDTTCLYEGIDAMLHTLHQKGYKLAIVSNKLNSAVQELNQRFFSDTIRLAIGTGEKAKKPNPYYVLEAIKELGSDRSDAIYVGDSDVDIETAANAGIPCIGVSWGFRGRDFLQQHHADYVIDTPEQLLQLFK